MRNERYRKNAISVRERHNERKNEVYSNPDVLLEYSRNNVTFKACEAATYAQQFDRMVEEGVVSTRGLKPDAYVFDELVFDVNTDYFETHGGYEYAKQFYAEVYELAKKIAGGEQYIISAVMHADERNREASDRLGRNVFHCWVSVKQFSKNDTATACQDWLRSTRLGRGSIKSHVRTVKVLGMGLFAFQERIHLWKGVTH